MIISRNFNISKKASSLLEFLGRNKQFIVVALQNRIY